MSLAHTLKQVDESIQYHHNAHAAVYAVQRGDTLSRILSDYYNIRAHTPEYEMAETYALYYNPNILHPDHIHIGDIIRLMPLPKDSANAFCPVPDDFYHHRLVATRHRMEPAKKHPSVFLRDNLPISEEEREIFFALARAQDKYHWLEVGAFGAASFQNLTGPSNLALIKEVGDLYEQFQNGKLTRNQYNYQRAKRLNTLSKKLGVMQRFLFEGQTTHEAISITRKKSLPATMKITSNLSRLSDLSTLAKSSGVLLTGVGGAIACDNIGNTEDRQEKNEIFVEFLGGTGGSAITGAALGLIFATTPIGWAAALAIGGATVAAGWAGGKISKKIYDNKFQNYDLVEGAGLDKWCS